MFPPLFAVSTVIVVTCVIFWVAARAARVPLKLAAWNWVENGFLVYWSIYPNTGGRPFGSGMAVMVGNTGGADEVAALPRAITTSPCGMADILAIAKGFTALLSTTG